MKKFLKFAEKPLSFYKGLNFKKKIIFFLVILVLTYVVIGRIQNLGKSKYITERVEKSSIVEYVTETGSVIDEGITKIYSPSTGIVEEIFVENGDKVIEGQDLFTVRSTATEEEKQKAAASYYKAASDLSSAQANSNSLRSSMYSAWESYRNLATNDTYETSSGQAKNEERLATEFQTAQDNWLSAEKLYKNSQTQIAAAQAALTAANLSYQSTQNATVKAQSNGIVANLSVSRGGSVQANVLSLVSVNSVSPALLLVTNQTKIKVIVGQSDIAKIKPGQKVILDPDAYQDINLNGTVERVDNIGIDKSGVVEFGVYIKLDKEDERLKSGMTLDAEIESKRVNNALTVSNSAVVLYRGQRAIRVVGQKKDIEYIPVKIGIRGNERTQILEGLNEGQEIITALTNTQVKRSGLLGM